MLDDKLRFHLSQSVLGVCIATEAVSLWVVTIHFLLSREMTDKKIVSCVSFT